MEASNNLFTDMALCWLSLWRAICQKSRVLVFDLAGGCDFHHRAIGYYSNDKRSTDGRAKRLNTIVEKARESGAGAEVEYMSSISPGVC